MLSRSGVFGSRFCAFGVASRYTWGMDETAELVTIEDILGAKTKQTAWVKICVKTELNEKLQDAENALRDARMKAARDPEDEVWKAQVVEAEAALEAITAERNRFLVTFTFEALGSTELEELERAHPPNREQLAEYRLQQKAAGLPATNPPKYNLETFPPALIARSCVSPAMSVEQATRLWNDPKWSRGELGALMGTAWQINALTQ